MEEPDRIKTSLNEKTSCYLHISVPGLNKCVYLCCSTQSPGWYWTEGQELQAPARPQSLMEACWSFSDCLGD